MEQEEEEEGGEGRRHGGADVAKVAAE